MYLEYRYSVKGIRSPDWHYTRDLLRLISAKNFVHYRPEHGMAVQVELYVLDDIGHTAQFHKDLADRLETSEIIPTEWIRKRQLTTKSLDKWLTIRDGCYVRPEDALELFLSETLRMLDLVIRYEHIDSGTQQYNRRVMHTVLLNAQRLASALAACHYQCMATR